VITARADVVGSLLRPPWLLKAQQDFAAGKLLQAAFKALEDRAVDEALELQERAGRAGQHIPEGPESADAAIAENPRTVIQDELALNAAGVGEQPGKGQTERIQPPRP